MTAEEKRLIRGFHVPLAETDPLRPQYLPESTTLGADLEARSTKYGLAEVASRSNAGSDRLLRKSGGGAGRDGRRRGRRISQSYGLTESGLVRLIRKSYELLGLISFFTVGEDECRAWTVPVNSRAQEAAGAIHTDLEKHFIRAETIHWDTLLAAGSEAAAKSQGTLRLEGKDYLVKDGDVMHIRHSG